MHSSISSKMWPEKAAGMDIRTPYNAQLSGFYQRSFAYQTIKFRLPATVGQISNIITKKKVDILKIYEEDAEEDVRRLVSDFMKLKSELHSNTPLRKFVGEATDIPLYNKCLDSLSSRLALPSYYNVTWLFCECYMFRRIHEAIEQCKFINDFDPYRLQKEDAYYRTVHLMALMANYLVTMLECSEEERKDEFMKLMELNLWGNKCDLSFKLSRVLSESEDLLNLIDLKPRILCNDLPKIWDLFTEDTQSQTLDVVLDNVGYELFLDMSLADFLITHGFAQHVRFYVKVIPWFVSDAMAKDIHWLLQQLSVSKVPILKKFGEKWTEYVRTEVWSIHEHNYWTLPLTYKEMDKWDLDLYRKLSQAKLIIFKGDVNYRKLVGETNWPPTKSFAYCLQGFNPSKIMTIRILKADIICGLEEDVVDRISNECTDWQITGNYGVIQLSDKIVRK